MIGAENQYAFEILIDFGFPSSDLVAVLPYAIPLLFVSLLLFFYQRHMPQDDMKRNVVVLATLICFVGAFFLVLYAGFGSVWWGPNEFTFGSWWAFITALQGLTDVIFSSVIIGIVFLTSITIVFAFLAYSVVSPPDPDFVGLREELKEAKVEASQATDSVQKIEVENKRLNEYLSEREDNLKVLEEELERLKETIEEREIAVAEMATKLSEVSEVPEIDTETEQEYLSTISRKDETISRLQSELADLRLVAESGEVITPDTPAKDESTKAIQEKLESVQSVLEDYRRRARTASEVADSVISDLAELISQVESSALDSSSKESLTSLIENLGRAVGRVAGHATDKDEGPKVEMIGAVMMVHEIVDAIKHLTRK